MNLIAASDKALHVDQRLKAARIGLGIVVELVHLRLDKLRGDLAIGLGDNPIVVQEPSRRQRIDQPCRLLARRLRVVGLARFVKEACARESPDNASPRLSSRLFRRIATC